MVNDEAAAVRELLTDRPDCTFFYSVSRTYGSGSTGDQSFYALVEDPQHCRALIERLCAEQQAESARIVAELAQLPEDERPYDPLIPNGCAATLCVVLPGSRYVVMQSQNWNNAGRSHHSALIPDVFDVEYYADKARHGEYSRFSVRVYALQA